MCALTRHDTGWEKALRMFGRISRQITAVPPSGQPSGGRRNRPAALLKPDRANFIRGLQTPPDRLRRELYEEPCLHTKKSNGSG